MKPKLTEDQETIRRRIYWLLLGDLLETSKSKELGSITERVRKLSDGALEAATKIVVENY